GPHYEGGLSIDNYGNSYNGAWRLNADLDINNPLQAGDRLSLRALVSDEAQHYLRGQYELPMGPWATRAGAAYSWMDYELGKDFEVLESTGTAGIATLYVVQPWWRQRQYGFSTQLAFDNKRLQDETGLFGLDSQKSLNNLSLQFNGYWRDQLLGGASTSYSLGWTAGDLSLDSRDAEVQDVLLRSAGKFQKWAPALYRQQLLASNLTLLLQARGQIASGNLDSAEKVSLGGAYGVRAYPEGEASGDEGWVANAEFRYALDEVWQAGFFLDAGGVTVNKNPVPGAGDNHRQLSGLGLAVYWQPDMHWQATVSAAWPISNDDPTSDTPRGNYIWGQLAWRY
ncbi:MAG: ShlB/FhaC/HecB family hemolysin secretion/activation protein, partial [Pedobacter sp.]|nr:ShlB/FhaC/HecB family hemolysin secretion/activation protein [Pedobacter sp.]